MIALAAMFMVKGLGVELRTLFSRSTSSLNLFGDNAPEEGTGNLNEPNPGPAPTPPFSEDPDPTVTPSTPDHDAECQQQRAALLQERDTVGASLGQARAEAQRQMQVAMRMERYWVRGYHSRWGWGGRGVQVATGHTGMSIRILNVRQRGSSWSEHKLHTATGIGIGGSGIINGSQIAVIDREIISGYYIGKR